nr:MAG TPA_asm: hypothetical protein [Caudoviricetes sp.]
MGLPVRSHRPKRTGHPQVNTRCLSGTSSLHDKRIMCHD